MPRGGNPKRDGWPTIIATGVLAGFVASWQLHASNGAATVVGVGMSVLVWIVLRLQRNG
jgi:hypothetical protein